MKVVQVLGVAPILESGELPTQTSLPLTFFDILWLRLPPVQRIFFYEFPQPTQLFFDTILPKLKHSLSLALGHFFPLAGHLIWPLHSAKPIINYNTGDTLLLPVAESHADFNHLAGTDLSEATEIHHLLPHLTTSHEQTTLLGLQVTLFPNSGFSIGITSHHAVLDGKTSATNHICSLVVPYGNYCSQAEIFHMNILFGDFCQCSIDIASPTKSEFALSK